MSARRGLTRRQFVQATAAAAATGIAVRGAPAVGKKRGPNLLLIVTDQQHSNTISAGGCRDIQTPGQDRLCQQGVRFACSYSANPLCSPARAAVLTGRTSAEAGVWRNNRGITKAIPHVGQWLAEKAGYEPVYAGKWHLPRSFTHDIPGFTVLTAGVSGQGNLGDTVTSRACEGWLRNRSADKPFLLVASFFQPHDICQWLRINRSNPGELRYPEIRDQLPALPANFEPEDKEPALVQRKRAGDEPSQGKWSPEHWRFYRWSYYRHVEMVDAEIGRVLQAIEDTGRAADTLVLLTSDHGEGMGHHRMVRKNCFYDECCAVPLVVSLAGHVAADAADRTTLVSGLDVVPTFCDYAGVEPPPHMRGVSLRPVLEGSGKLDRGHIVSEVSDNRGRMVRTARYKYIKYAADPVEQLFDMQADPGETKNLATASEHRAALREHRRLLTDWEIPLVGAPGLPLGETWRKKGI